MPNDSKATVAARLREAETSLQPIAPFAHELGVGNIAVAYEVQRINVKHWCGAGRRKVGRKIGLTSKTVQLQLGVDQPDYGTLFADMEIGHGDTFKRERLIAPRVEAEIALVLERDVTDADATIAQVMQAISLFRSSCPHSKSLIAGSKTGRSASSIPSPTMGHHPSSCLG
jgi:2-keto-4-pentenoate hydratase